MEIIDEYHYRCPVCGQPVDKRDLSQVFEHEHAGLPEVPKDIKGKKVGEEKTDLN